MDITFINVGYGDAILIRESSFTMLVDGGSGQSDEYVAGSDRIRAVDYLKYMGIMHIDLLVITHIHEDHVCGLEAVLDEIEIGEIRIPFSLNLFSQLQEFALLKRAQLFTKAINSMMRIVVNAQKKRIPVKTLCKGEMLHPLDGLTLHALAPSESVRAQFEHLFLQTIHAADPTVGLIELDHLSNDTSLLLLVEGKELCCLLTGDSCPPSWSNVDRSWFRNVNVLKLPHHGQGDCLDEKLYREMPLEAVVTTASSDQRHNSAYHGVYESLHDSHPKAQLLFVDIRNYPPFFNHPSGCQAIQISKDSGKICTNYISVA